MSLEDIKLPFLGIRTLPDKFRVAVCGNSKEYTKYAIETPQFVIHVILEPKEGQLPIKNSPADNFLSLSNHARKSLRKKGIRHLDEINGKIVSFKKVTAEGYTTDTIEAVKIEAW